MILIVYGINNRKSQVSSNFLKTSKRSFKKGDYLLCGSLTQPYKINMKDKIIVSYENLRDININIL